LAETLLSGDFGLNPIAVPHALVFIRGHRSTEDGIAIALAVTLLLTSNGLDASKEIIRLRASRIPNLRRTQAFYIL